MTDLRTNRAADEAREALVSEAWRILSDLVHEGKTTLRGGRTLEPTTGELTRTFQWLASLKPPRKKYLDIPEDFGVPKTIATKESKA